MNEGWMDETSISINAKYYIIMHLHIIYSYNHPNQHIVYALFLYFCIYLLLCPYFNEVGGGSSLDGSAVLP